MAVKSKKETKVTKKTVEEPTAAGSKRKTVTFSEKEAVVAKPAKKKTKKVVEKKVVAEAKEVEKEEEEVAEEEEEEEEQTLNDVEDLTEEQEEALRKKILGDLQSSDEEDSSEDEDALGKNESMVILDEEQIKKSKEETKESFDKKIKSSPKADEEEERGVIYLGHIPHGFYEDEMRGYFTQFGNITNLRLSRSKKTGNSRHYAYIEFESADVARIVAETMNNYLLFEKMLKCVVIPPERIHPDLFLGTEKKYKHFNWTALNRNMINKTKTADQLKAHQEKLTKNYGKKQRALKKAGFDYELPKLN